MIWHIVNERDTDKRYGSFDSEESARERITKMLQVVTRIEDNIIWFTHRALSSKTRWERWNERND